MSVTDQVFSQWASDRETDGPFSFFKGGDADKARREANKGAKAFEKEEKKRLKEQSALALKQHKVKKQGIYATDALKLEYKLAQQKILRIESMMEDWKKKFRDEAGMTDEDEIAKFTTLPPMPTKEDKNVEFAELSKLESLSELGEKDTFRGYY